MRPMPIPNDTHPEVERMQIEILQEVGMARRLHLTFSLTQFVLDLSAEALRRRHPELPETERKLLGVALRYGAELADEVRVHMIRRQRDARACWRSNMNPRS